jgi:hypothetical protein
MGAVVLRGTAGREHPLTLRERALYHQIHPAKLFADISTAFIGIDLFWHHELVAGLVIALLTPALVSAALLYDGNFEPLRASRMGAYLRRFQPPWVLAIRLFGVGLAFYAAWYHVPAGSIGGVAIVAVCWANGLIPRRLLRSHPHVSLDSLRPSKPYNWR